MGQKSPSCANDSMPLRQSTEWMPFLSKYPQTFSDKYNQEFRNVSGNTKEPRECPYALQKEVQTSDVPRCLISNQTANLPSSRQHAIGTQDIPQIQGREQRAQKESHACVVNLSLTKEVRRSHGDKTASAMNCAGETGPLHAQHHTGFLSRTTYKNLTLNRLLQHKT